MATRSPIDPTLLTLFTAPERTLLAASHGAALERATKADLGRLLARARLRVAAGAAATLPRP